MSEDKKKQEGTTQTLNFQFGSVTVNGPMFDIHDNENVYINAEGRSSSSEQGRKTPPEPEKKGEGKRGQKNYCSVRSMRRCIGARCFLIS